MKSRYRQPTETGPLVALEQGPYALTIAPGFGARMVSFRHAGRDVLRPTPDAVLARPTNYGFAGFPLMPYSGPMFGPGFTFGGITYPLARNVREEPTATHGELWISPFKIVDVSKAAVLLEMTHDPTPGTFPFRFRGMLRYSLS